MCSEQKQGEGVVADCVVVEGKSGGGEVREIGMARTCRIYPEAARAYGERALLKRQTEHMQLVRVD